MTRRHAVPFIYFLVVIMTLLMRISSSLGIYGALGVEDSDAYFTCVVQLIIFGVLPISLYLISQRCGSKRALCDFGVKRVSAKNALRTLLLAICMIVVGSGVSYVWQIALSLLGYRHVSSPTDYYNIGVLFKEFALVAVLPAIFEEVSHRGLIYAGYREYGFKFAIISALLFALMHQNIVQTGYTFVDGLAMALAMYYTGSIFPGMFMHFLNNGYSVFSEYVAQNGGPFSFINVVSDFLNGTVVGMAISVIAFVLFAVLAAVILARMRKDAVKAGAVNPESFYVPDDVLPLYKDVPFMVTVALGVAVTTFSLVWGIMR